MNLLISYILDIPIPVRITDEDLLVEMSRISKFMLLKFNKALFLSMCVHFPCVHTVESYSEIVHSECISIVKYFAG